MCVRKIVQEKHNKNVNFIKYNNNVNLKKYWIEYRLVQFDLT